MPPPTILDTAASSRPQYPIPRPKSRRPASLAELAERARNNGWDPNLGIKHWLKTAERHRNNGSNLVKSGDLEAGFVELATAATLVMEKVPSHRDYHTMLNHNLRKNLGTNGQEILDSLSQLKPVLLERHERWLAEHPNETDSPSDSIPDPKRDSGSGRSPNEDAARSQGQQGAYREDADRRLRERYGREDSRQRQDGDPRRRTSEATQTSGRGAEALAAARAAAGLPAGDYGTPRYDDGRDNANRLPIPDFQRQEDTRRQQEEMKRREEDITRRRGEERRRQEQDGIARRQQEAKAAANAALGHQNQPLAGVSYPQQQTSKFPENLMMPLESPTRYDDDSTDAESVAHGSSLRVRRADHHRPQGTDPTPSRTPQRNASYPPPITTTSPSKEGIIRYPTLMTKHQMKQGYAPSLASMFSPSMKAPNAPASLLFEPDSKAAALYSSNMLPQPSAPANIPNTYGMPTAQSYPSQQPHGRHSDTYPGGSRPHPQRQSVPQSSTQQPSDSSRIVRSASRGDPVVHELKNVNLPRDCLPRFLSIAAINTARNRETCGLLLGKDKGHKFVVTTLLIPKQHSTSDTCTMDEEELVMQFTEERNLITLGWIHTHPSQSCFMSSVDLHTHSGFQRMLPESFAVVCAPKSAPNFGIFRLTDPPGLQTILDCTVKEAFHPHPDKPIYTDADKGHVQMRDMSLEIVDLR